MKKKLVAFMLVISMLAVAVVGGTLAYFTDEDYAENVMTIGNVDIEQTEWQRDGEGGFEEFEQNKLLMPGVYDSVSASKQVYFNDEDTLNIADGNAWCDFWDAEGTVPTENAVDKIVVVKNTGDNDVFYRTLVAIETTEAVGTKVVDGDYSHDVIYNFNSNNRFDRILHEVVTINGQNYAIIEFQYNVVLEPGEMSRPSLLQFMLSKDMTQEDVAGYNGSLEVLCLSQAVQADGFNGDAAAALEAAYGDVMENVVDWFMEYVPQA